MNLHSVTRHIAAASFFLSVTSLPQVVCAQVFSSKRAELPSPVRLSDVEIRLVTGGGDGCRGRCVNYRITVRGDGVVELEDLGDLPRAGTQRRSIAEDEVVALVNEFLGARFFDVLDNPDGTLFAVRKGAVLNLNVVGTAGSGPWVEVTMRLGSASKTVHLKENAPVELGRLKDLVWRIGGPPAWPVK